MILCKIDFVHVNYLFQKTYISKLYVVIRLKKEIRAIFKLTLLGITFNNCNQVVSSASFSGFLLLSIVVKISKISKFVLFITSPNVLNVAFAHADVCGN